MQEKELVYHNLGSIICSSISVRGHCSVNYLCDLRQAPSWPQSFPESLNTFPSEFPALYIFNGSQLPVLCYAQKSYISSNMTVMVLIESVCECGQGRCLQVVCSPAPASKPVPSLICIHMFLNKIYNCLLVYLVEIYTHAHHVV